MHHRANRQARVLLVKATRLWRTAAGAALISLAACGGAGLATKAELEGKTGSCEVACEHYEYCKGEDDPQRETSCVRECRNIFSEDGTVDVESLYRLESLSCRQLLLFIEGTGARPTGSPEA